MTDSIKFVTLLESDLPKLVMSGPVSQRTTFSLRVDGPWSSREAANLVKLIELQVSWLEADEAAAARAALAEGDGDG